MIYACACTGWSLKGVIEGCMLIHLLLLLHGGKLFLLFNVPPGVSLLLLLLSPGPGCIQTTICALYSSIGYRIYIQFHKDV